MKNVAKCDTWCELQNPANHRVFERKLRPRPLGRGHACLGVTPKHAPTPLIGNRDAASGPSSRKGRWTEDRAAGVPRRTQRMVGVLALSMQCIRRAAGIMAFERPNKRSARRFDRDPRSGGTTR